MGSKPKFWFRYNDEDWLFKIARENTGEHWAEKVASEIAANLNLPTHRVELATYEGKRGSAVRSFLKKSEVLVHGNEVLGGSIDGYERDKQRGQADHNFDNIVAVLRHLFTDMNARLVASWRIVGYLVFDALVGNTDRHHENWGILLRPTRHQEDGKPIGFTIEIAPTFDHASSLGRELLDDKRKALLDETGALERYIRKARGGIHANADARRGMSPIALVEMIANRHPEFFDPWQKRIERFDQTFAKDVVSRAADDWMSETAKKFALAFMEQTRRLLLSIG